MTVKKMTEEDKKKAELVQSGYWPVQPVGSKGLQEAQKRFGKSKSNG